MKCREVQFKGAPLKIRQPECLFYRLTFYRLLEDEKSTSKSTFYTLKIDFFSTSLAIYLESTKIKGYKSLNLFHFIKEETKYFFIKLVVLFIKGAKPEFVFNHAHPQIKYFCHPRTEIM